MFVMLLKV